MADMKLWTLDNYRSSGAPAGPQNESLALDLTEEGVGMWALGCAPAVRSMTVGHSGRMVWTRNCPSGGWTDNPLPAEFRWRVHLAIQIEGLKEALKYNAQLVVLEALTDAISLSGPTPGDVGCTTVCVEAGASFPPPLSHAYPRVPTIAQRIKKWRLELFGF
jgi:hypothetical protein